MHDCNLCALSQVAVIKDDVLDAGDLVVFVEPQEDAQPVV